MQKEDEEEDEKKEEERGLVIKWTRNALRKVKAINSSGP